MTRPLSTTAALRPFPAWAPQIGEPETRNPERACAECEAPHEDRAEVRHTQAAGVPGAGGAVLFTSRMPLCDACAAAARRLGWTSLKVTWRKLTAAPDLMTALLTAQTLGGRQ